jgi:hypothetical protein
MKNNSTRIHYADKNVELTSELTSDVVLRLPNNDGGIIPAPSFNILTTDGSGNSYWSFFSPTGPTGPPNYGPEGPTVSGPLGPNGPNGTSVPPTSSYKYGFFKDTTVFNLQRDPVGNTSACVSLPYTSQNFTVVSSDGVGLSSSTNIKPSVEGFYTISATSNVTTGPSGFYTMVYIVNESTLAETPISIVGDSTSSHGYDESVAPGTSDVTVNYYLGPNDAIQIRTYAVFDNVGFENVPVGWTQNILLVTVMVVSGQF